MEKPTKFDTISEQFIKENSVSALATKPNQTATYGTGNLTATELKAHFDSLVKKVIGLYNTLAKALNGENGEDAAEYITLKETEGGSLRGLLSKIIDENGNLKLGNETISAIIGGIKDSIGEIEADASGINVKINEKTNSLGAILGELIKNSLDLSKEGAQTMKGPLVTGVIKALGKTGSVQFTDTNGNASMWVGATGAVANKSTAVNTAIRVQNAIVDALAEILQLEVKENASVGGTLGVGGKLSALGDLDVGGNLNVKGKPINQIQESIIVKDNFIVTNSSGASFSQSGLAIRLEGTTDAAYGIYYDPDTKVVMISEGTLSGDTGDVEFTPTSDKAVPLAARDGFGSESGGFVPMWNATQNAFVPSGAKVDANGNFNIMQGDKLLPLATETYVNTYVDGQLDGIADILDKINNGGSTE